MDTPIMRAEAQAIQKAAEELNEYRFNRMVELIAALNPAHELERHKGKLIVTGVGKSAIQARAIAATFATCIVPAHFYDPVGLYHGELGAIGSGDMALLISHSGETEELLRLIPCFQAKGCWLMAITKDENSTLGRLPMSLYTHVDEEAFARIPTASASATESIGRELACAVARRKKLDAERLAIEHPGGTIGKESVVEATA